MNKKAHQLKWETMAQCLLSLLILFSAIYLTSCKEDGPIILLEEAETPLVDTTYVVDNVPEAEQKVVLMEEFTGVRCTNCPIGHAKVAELYAAHGERFIAIGVHSNFLGAPYEGNEDFRTESANSLNNALGPVNGKPSAFIDRRVFPSNQTRDIINPDLWTGFVAQQLAATTPLNLDLEIVEINENERLVRYRTTLTYTENAQAHNLGFAITENNLIAAQLNAGTVIEDYNHQHVLRKYITPIMGIPLAIDLEMGRVIIKEFELEVPLEWNIDNLELIAFIRASNDEIVQAKMAKFN